LGALLCISCEGLKNYPTIKVEDLPRMAEPIKWLTACETALWQERGVFKRLYEENKQKTVTDALEKDPFAQFIVKNLPKPFSGTATDLYNRFPSLHGLTATQRKQYPQSAAGVGNALKRLEEPLENIYGIKIERSRTDKERLIYITHDSNDGNDNAFNSISTPPPEIGAAK
ncbi:MAG: hypothetical protein ACTSXQ_05595, partial [Alphaproteobacteria bacterium]